MVFCTVCQKCHSMTTRPIVRNERSLTQQHDMFIKNTQCVTSLHSADLNCGAEPLNDTLPLPCISLNLRFEANRFRKNRGRGNDVQQAKQIWCSNTRCTTCYVTCAISVRTCSRGTVYELGFWVLPAVSGCNVLVVLVLRFFKAH